MVEAVHAILAENFTLDKACFFQLTHVLNNGGWFVLEHSPRNDYKNFPFYKSERNYGTTIFSTFVENREL